MQLYEAGARTIDDLVKHPDKYGLNLIERNGAIHFEDLLNPITVNEEGSWRALFQEKVLELPHIILNNHIESRESGIHSRMEVTICLIGPYLDIMAEFLNKINQFIPDGMDSVFETFNDYNEVSGTCHIARARVICSLPSPERTGRPRKNKSVIVDLTFYSPIFHPFPILRHLKEFITPPFILNDFGLFGEDGIKLNGRKVLGRDNPHSLEEIEMICRKE